MKLYLVRHGEKAKGDFFNSRLRHNDQPLSAFGRRQALSIGKYFPRGSIQAIYISEYLRTEQTALPLASELGLVPIKDRRLNEMDIGIAENLSLDELREMHPKVWKALQDRKGDFRWPEGETGAEAQKRIVGFIQEHTAQEDDILIVAHDGIIRILVCYVLGLPVHQRYRFQVDTASITEIEWDANKGIWKLIRFNQRST